MTEKQTDPFDAPAFGELLREYAVMAKDGIASWHADAIRDYCRQAVEDAVEKAQGMRWFTRGGDLYRLDSSGVYLRSGGNWSWVMRREQDIIECGTFTEITSAEAQAILAGAAPAPKQEWPRWFVRRGVLIIAEAPRSMYWVARHGRQWAGDLRVDEMQGLGFSEITSAEAAAIMCRPVESRAGGGKME